MTTGHAGSNNACGAPFHDGPRAGLVGVGVVRRAQKAASGPAADDVRQGRGGSSHSGAGEEGKQWHTHVEPKVMTSAITKSATGIDHSP